MKRMMLLVMVVLVSCLVLSGCGKTEEKKLSGKWYSNKPDTLILNKDGKTYASEWMDQGEYSVEDGKLTLKNTNPLDGSTKVFEIKKENGKTILYYPEKDYRYFDNKEDAQKLLDEKKAAEEKVKAEKAAAGKAALKKVIVGVWTWSGFNQAFEFTGDGLYTFENYTKNIWRYEIVDGETLKFIKENGETFEKKIKFTETETEYIIVMPDMTLIKSKAEAAVVPGAETGAAADAETVQASKDLLNSIIVGIWDWDGFEKSVEFTGDGKYLFENYKQNIWKFSVVDGATIRFTKDTGETFDQHITLKKTAAGYSIVMPDKVLIKK